MILCERVSEPGGLDEAIQMDIAPDKQIGPTIVYGNNMEDEQTLLQCSVQIKMLQGTMWQTSMQIGGILLAAKRCCASGMWEQWVEDNCLFSIRSARRYMEIADKYSKNPLARQLPGSTVLAIDGALGKDFVALFDEFAQMAIDNDMSQRQITKKVKEEIARLESAKAEAEQRAEDAAHELENAVNAAQEIEDDLEREKTTLTTQLRDAQQRAEALEQNLTDARERMEQLRTERDDARRAQIEPKTVEKCVEVYPVDYDAAKAENETLKRERDAQAQEMERLRRELAAARREAGTHSAPKPDAAEKTASPAKTSGAVQAITAAQVGEMVSTFLDRMEDVARQQFDFMPAAMAGEYLDQIARVEQFCVSLRAVISGE